MKVHTVMPFNTSQRKSDESISENPFPSQSVIFLPVGTGDSTTIVIDDEHVIQVDLHHMDQANEEDSKYVPVVDFLKEWLPKRNGHPYLAVFALTHADEDHCQGFGALLDSDILIGELWATPKLWREYAEDNSEPCEDAHRFHEEADRRVQTSLKHIRAGHEIQSGDRVRVIGYDTDFDDTNHPYRDLPDEQKSFPSQLVTTVDGDDVSDRFEAFIHAPFKDDCAAARNETSLAMQVTLKNGDTKGRVLLLGDLAYPTLQRIFDQTKDKDPDRVAWEVLLAPHHCSRKVMYAANEQGKEELKQDIMDALESSRGERAYIVASSEPIPGSNQPGDNPPHAKAKARYRELGIEDFLCTQESGDINAPEPIIFTLTPGVGLELQPAEAGETASLEKAALVGIAGMVAAIAVPKLVGILRAAIKRARGADAAPTKPVGFGLRKRQV
jgi:beta-lactamase superfamily II metal-dependent hydrolase